MEGFVLVLALAAIPVAGNFLGSALAEFVPVSAKTLNLALHAAAGIILGVVGLELFPEALTATPAWVPIIAFALGGVLFLGIEKFTHYAKERFRDKSGPLGIYLSVALDLLSDGILIGTGTVVNPALGLLLAAGQAPADVPEGFAATSSLRQARISRSRRLLIAASFAMPIFIGAVLGFFALQNAPELVTLSVLALTGGILTAFVTEELLSDAHETEEPRYAVLFLVSGFALFALVSHYFGL